MAKEKQKKRKRGRPKGSTNKNGKKIKLKSLIAESVLAPEPEVVAPLKGVSQPSVAVKILLFTVFIYLFVLAAYLIGKWYFFFEIPQFVFGFKSGLVVLLAQMFIMAAGATIGTKLFLINPIKKLKETIEEVGRGDFLVRADYEGRDEIGDLAAHFNRMLDSLTELNADKMKAEHELLAAYENLKSKDRLERKDNDIKDTNKALESLVEELSLLYEIGKSVNSTIEMAELYRLLEEVMPRQLGLNKFALLLADDKKEYLNVTAAAGFDPADRISELSFKIGEGISGEVMMNGEPDYVPDVEKDGRYLHYKGEKTEKGSFLSIPLRFKKDILGVMNCSRTKVDAFDIDEIRLLTLVANQIALAVENALLYTKTRELSVRDDLTGIYNRRHFQQVLQMEWKRASRFRRPLSLLMIDIDYFKNFNDTFGHPQGDKVLKLIAGLIVKNIREVDTVARFGGEEFIVLLPDTDKEGALVVAEKVRRLVEIEPFNEGAKFTLPLTISVGVATYLEDAREMDDLIDHADVALYEAKDAGRNKVVAYSDMVEVTERTERVSLTSN